MSIPPMLIAPPLRRGVPGVSVETRAKDASAKEFAATLASHCAADSKPERDENISTETVGSAPAFPSSATIAVTMQIIASLPMLTPPASLPDAPASDGDSIEPLPAPYADSVRFNFAAVSLPATPFADLQEDHFDVASAERVVVDGDDSGMHRDSDASEINTEGTHGVQKSLEKLNPEFRSRLERVMARLRREYGHSVTVVETVRSQARQDALFAQGRSTDGPVVTWTKHSKHAKGMAADVQIDGQWSNPVGYARLAEVAKQEGLRTLGARDPGHVEMDGAGRVSSETLRALLGDLQTVPGNGTAQLSASVRVEDEASGRNAAMARVANVAQVARVATVASVARVADVARPGEKRALSNGADSMSQFAAVSPVTAAGALDLAGATRVVTPMAAVNMTDRISQLMDLQSAQDARPLSSVLLRLENAAGNADQIRIDARGSSVDAQLGLGNVQQAAAITERIGELREALERRGLTADGVRVQPASRSTDSASFSRSVAPTIELAAMRAASDSQFNGASRDNTGREQSQQREAFAREQQARHNSRASSDDARHRSRREQPEDRT